MQEIVFNLLDIQIGGVKGHELKPRQVLGEKDNNMDVVQTLDVAEV